MEVNGLPALEFRRNLLPRGDHIGIYCYNNRADEGYIDIDYLHYQNKNNQ